MLLAQLLWLALWHPLLVCSAAPETTKEESAVVYQVNRKVADFPSAQDLSTPEAAYCAISRLCAAGEQDFWPKLSVERLAKNMPTGLGKRAVSSTAVDGWLNAEILEVHLLPGKYAAVLARVPHPRKTIIDFRGFEPVNGQWLNAGNGVFGSLESAREAFAETCAYYRASPFPKRRPVDNPQAHLKPFVDFLVQRAEEPLPFVMRALIEHKIVIMGEIHHRPVYWAFNAALVRHPDFAKRVGTIYLELPSNDQGLVDRFLEEPQCDANLVVRVLRDMLWMGWPDQAMLDFFVAVWQVNQSLPAPQRLRLVLVDMERPWDKIQQRDDWRRYDGDRDQFMAESILKDMESRPSDPRNGLFIVGAGHAALGLSRGQIPERTAGWHLAQRLGRDRVFALLQHRCVMSNTGDVAGRLCLGLFESAFAQVQNRPVAFTLEEGPFGAQPYDASPEARYSCRYADGFDGYLYLCPLEDEAFSGLIQDFYTDDFVRELDRRHRVMFGGGLQEAYRLPKLEGSQFAAWMSQTWGNPRDWRKFLGPLDAWWYGDDWEKEICRRRIRLGLEHPEQIRNAAQRLFAAIRSADYQQDGSGSGWRAFLPEDVAYQVDHHFDTWVTWVCRTFGRNPIKAVDLGQVFENQQGLPAIPYKVTLADGRVLEGTLPFTYLPRQQLWMGVQGIDWHLQYPIADEKAASAKPDRAVTMPDVHHEEPSQPGSIQGSGIDRSSPEATVISWAQAMAAGRLTDALACMVPGTRDYAKVEAIRNTEATSGLKELTLAIDAGRPIEILAKTETADGTCVSWRFFLKRDVPAEGQTLKAGDVFELDAVLIKREGLWLLDSL